MNAVTWGVRKVRREGYRYSKAGIVTVDLVILQASQRALIDAIDRERGMALVEVMDGVTRDGDVEQLSRRGRCDAVTGMVDDVRNALATVHDARDCITSDAMWAIQQITRVLLTCIHTS